MHRPKIRSKEPVGEMAAGDKAVADAMVYDMQNMYKRRGQPSNIGIPPRN